MSTLPLYVWITVLTGLLGTTATACVMLWRGALTADLSRRTATAVAAAVGILWAAWTVASAALGDADVYRFAPTKIPWLPIALVASLAGVLSATRIPVVSRILAQPDALWRLTMPQLFRLVGVAFLLVMALGQLPAVFALPAGLGDIAIGVESVFVTRNLRRGVGGRRGAWLFNILGLVDLVVALAIGFLAAPGRLQLLFASPTTEAISLLPLALIPTTVVPLAAALHLLSLWKLSVRGETKNVVTPVGSTL